MYSFRNSLPILILLGSATAGYFVPAFAPAACVLAMIWFWKKNRNYREALGEQSRELGAVKKALCEKSGEAESTARAKSAFLATMNHEIRTPMSGILGMTGLLLSSERDSHHRECLEGIQESAESLLTVLNDVLDFARIEMDKLALDVLEFDLRTVVGTVTDLLAPQAQAKGLDFAYLVHHDVPASLKGDPGRVRQILLNLVRNAIQFTEQGEVVVAVKRLGQENDRVKLRFEVIDTGIGVSKDQGLSIFEPFTQAEHFMSRKCGGTGLGLSISKQLARLMDGDVGFESEPGIGSTFWFTADFQEAPERLQPAVPRLESLHGVCVLVAEDSPRCLAVLCEQLSQFGMVVESCGCLLSALEKLDSAANEGQPFQLAIIDYRPPLSDGMTLAAEVRKRRHLDVEMVLMTSMRVRGDAALAQEGGFAAYLTKPVDSSSLRECLAKVIERKATSNRRQIVTRHSLKEENATTRSRVLVVNPEDRSQRATAGLLERRGLRVDVAANGLEAVTATSEVDYALVLISCALADPDAYQATQQIRNNEDPERSIAIVGMSANPTATDHERCLSSGMDDLVDRPLSPETSEETLEQWVRDPVSA